MKTNYFKNDKLTETDIITLQERNNNLNYCQA